ncbi:MAG: sulfatase-like hydrolase/transferase [Oscillospiraceae bacterium]|nr:sulfatase-like hydrolase/transferase [Oscillospiraceae bacterium]
MEFNFKNIKLELNKKNCIIALVFFVFFGLLLAFNFRLFIEDGSFDIPAFIGAIMLLFLTSSMLAVKITFPSRVNRIVTILVFVASIVFSYVIMELLNRNYLFDIYFRRLLFNFIIIFIVHLALLTISNNTKLTIILANSLIFALGLVNYVVSDLRGTPLVPWDFLTIRTAATIASHYTFTFDFYIFLAGFSLLFLVSIALKLKHTIKMTRYNIMLRFACLFVIMGLSTQFYRTDMIDLFGLQTNPWRPAVEYSRNGFLASFVKQSRNLFNRSPEVYCLDTIRHVAELYTKPHEEPMPFEDMPNIIVIMNESFADLRVNGDFRTNEDFIPFFRSLANQPNVIQGNAHTSIFGAPTSNSEWEFLTNNSMAFMPPRTIPFQQYIRRPSPSLVRVMRELGYTTSGIHSWNAVGWRRNVVYPLLGFETFYSLETMPDLEFIRMYPSDLSTYREIIRIFEAKEPDERIFNFTLTMQNHSGFDYEDFESTIFLSDIYAPRVEQYLSLLRLSDYALEYLINYFSNVDERTIILFFGDHQPPHLEDEFWEYLLPYDEDAYTKYLTPFMIWANYDIETREVSDISLNFLSILLMDVIGLETTPYMNFLRSVQEILPVITGNGFIDRNGIVHTLGEETEYYSLLQLYQMIQYNNVFDTSNRVENFFSLGR